MMCSVRSRSRSRTGAGRSGGAVGFTRVSFLRVLVERAAAFPVASGFGAHQFRLEGGVEAEFAGGRLLADEALVEGGGDAVQVRLRLADGRGGEGDGELV